jgi:hypothetical protein
MSLDDGHDLSGGFRSVERQVHAVLLLGVVFWMVEKRYR